MGSADNRKTKKRKTRKPAKLSSPSQNVKSLPQMTNFIANPQASEIQLPQSGQEISEKDIQEIAEIEELMDGEREPMDRGLSRVPNTYLGGDRCLLCHCERPNPVQSATDGDEPDPSDSKSGVGAVSQSELQLPLWVCPDCRKTVEEEERRTSASMLQQDLRPDPPIMPLVSNLRAVSPDTIISKASPCSCDACTERRQIEAEHEQETQELQQCWMELRHVVRYVYREAGTGLSSKSENSDITSLPDVDKMKQLVHRLISRDAHQLFQRLESQGREYVIEMKVRLLKQLGSGHKTPVQARQFMSMLLEEYSNLCGAAKTLASFLTELESEHLKRFNLTWELHNKHLFHTIIYTDQMVHNSLQMLTEQLRSGVASKESYHDDTYSNTLHRYLKFDDEMSVVSVVWRDCQQLIDSYNDEQATLKAKQKMLKEDWEFFKEQRKLLEQQVLKKKVPTATLR